MIKILEDNPYKDKLIASQARTKRYVVKKGEPQELNGQMVQVIAEKAYTPVRFSRVYQYKTLMEELSSDACKVLLHIVLTLGYEEQKVYIRRDEIGMTKRIFSRSMLELLTIKLITPVAHKRELYWIDLDIICSGTIARAEHQSPTPTNRPIPG